MRSEQKIDYCLTRSELIAYLDGTMSESERRRAEEIFTQCTLCSEAIDGLYALSRKERERLLSSATHPFTKSSRWNHKLSFLKMNKQVAYTAAASIALLLTIFILYRLFDSKSEEQLALERARQEIEFSGDPLSDSIALMTRKSLDSQINKLTMKKTYRDLIAQRNARRRVNDSIRQATQDDVEATAEQSPSEIIDSNLSASVNNSSASQENVEVKEDLVTKASEPPPVAPKADEKSAESITAQIASLESDIQNLSAEGRLTKVFKLHSLYLKVKDPEKARNLIKANIKIYKQKQDKEAVKQLEDLL